MRTALLLMLAVLTGCTNTRSTDYCLIAQPIYGTREDANRLSDQLLGSLYAHNCTVKTICKLDINLDCE